MYDIDKNIAKLGGALPQGDAPEDATTSNERGEKILANPAAVLELRKDIGLEQKLRLRCPDDYQICKSGPTFAERAQGCIAMAEKLCLLAGEFSVKHKHDCLTALMRKLTPIAKGAPDGKSYKDTMPTSKGKSLTWAAYSGHLNQGLRKFEPCATLLEQVNEAEKANTSC